MSEAKNSQELYKAFVMMDVPNLTLSMVLLPREEQSQRGSLYSGMVTRYPPSGCLLVSSALKSSSFGPVSPSEEAEETKDSSLLPETSGWLDDSTGIDGVQAPSTIRANKETNRLFFIGIFLPS